MLLRELLSTHLSPVLRCENYCWSYCTRHTYRTSYYVLSHRNLLLELVHNWLPHTAVTVPRTSCGLASYPTMRYGTITDPTRRHPQAPLCCGQATWRACRSKRSSREFLIINQDEHIRDKSAFEMVIGGQLYPSQSCAALACTAGSVAYM